MIVFASVWQQYALNVPKWDDHALRAFLFYSDQETTLSGKIYQLFKQHNEHRIVYDRIVTTLDYWLFGKLNYVHLMFVGNLSLAGLVAVFAAVLRQARRPLIYAAPVALLIFNLSHWENMFWGMAALQNFSVVLWVVAAIYFLSYTKQWGLAFVAAVLATLTSGNGLVVWPIGFVLLALRRPDYQTDNDRRALRPLIGWLIGAGVVIGLYFTGFEKPADTVYERPMVLDLLKGLFAFMGAAAEALPIRSALNACILLGGLMTLATLGVVAIRILTNRAAIVQAVRHVISPKITPLQKGNGIPSRDLFVWGCAGFILATAAVVALARTGFGIDILITSRYKLYSITLLSLLYVYAVATLDGRTSRWLMRIGITAGVVFASLSYGSFLDETIWWRHWMTTTQFNATHSTNRPIAISDPVSKQYTLPVPAFYDAALPTIYGPARQPTTDLQVTRTANGFSVKNTTLPTSGLGDSGAYLLARSAKRTYLFPVWQNRQAIGKAGFNPLNLFSAGFKANFLDAELDAGSYQLFVLTVLDAGTYKLHPTHQTILSAGPPVAKPTKNW
ncbi:hypothetical protein GCM10027190_03220 [Spirosoma areae]